MNVNLTIDVSDRLAALLAEVAWFPLYAAAVWGVFALLAAAVRRP